MRYVILQDKEKSRKREDDGKERRHRDRDDEKRRRHRDKDDGDDDERRRRHKDKNSEDTEKSSRRHRDDRVSCFVYQVHQNFLLALYNYISLNDVSFFAFCLALCDILIWNTVS